MLTGSDNREDTMNTTNLKKVLVKFQGSTLPIFLRPNSPDMRVAKSCFSGEFEHVKNFVSPEKCRYIIDAGGYIGTAALVLADMFPNARVFSLEPSQENFALLKKNTRRVPRIVPIKAALSSTSGTLTLRDRRTGQWGYSVVDEAYDCPDAAYIEKVVTFTLGDFLDIFLKDDKVELLKMDIEGAEGEVLSNSVDVMDKVDTIVCELHERIVPGVSKIYETSTIGWTHYKSGGEKVISVRRES
jgi:FkbM family methyltransferase